LSRHYLSMDSMYTIGHQIRTLREKAEMPLRKLASLLDIDQSTLSKIERDERKANLKMIEDLSNIFKVDRNKLLVNYYSDIVSYQIEEENNYAEILKIAEAKIEYKRSVKSKENE
jgi:HTH-type transcriptional regulator, competence development regulator